MDSSDLQMMKSVFLSPDLCEFVTAWFGADYQQPVKRLSDPGKVSSYANKNYVTNALFRSRALSSTCTTFAPSHCIGHISLIIPQQARYVWNGDSLRIPKHTINPFEVYQWHHAKFQTDISLLVATRTGAV